MLNATDVAASWTNTPSLQPAEEKILASVFWRLLAGKPVAPAELAAELRVSPATLEQELTRLAAKRCLRRDGSGAVVASQGLMVQPSPHRLRTEWGTVSTQCTVDAIGIPAALGIAATVDDRCACCDSPITAEIRGREDISVQPAGAVIVMAQADCGVQGAIPTMCQETNFFCSNEHARSWQEEQGTLPSAIVTIADAAAVGQAIWGRFARDRGEEYGGHGEKRTYARERTSREGSK
jgi:hypothetical protein